ncbi:MAG: hypothetical protein ACKPHU_29380, partial [Planctomycetaceae bacterium]
MTGDGGRHFEPPAFLCPSALPFASSRETSTLQTPLMAPRQGGDELTGTHHFADGGTHHFE